MMKKIKVTLEWEDISIYFTNYTFFKRQNNFSGVDFYLLITPLEIKLSLLQLYASFQPVKQPFSPLLYCFRLSFTSLKS